MRALLVAANIVALLALLATQLLCCFAVFGQLYPVGLAFGYFESYSVSGSSTIESAVEAGAIHLLVAVALFVGLIVVPDRRRDRWRGPLRAVRQFRNAVLVGGLPSLALFSLGMIPVFWLKFAAPGIPGQHVLAEELTICASYLISWIPVFLAARLRRKQGHAPVEETSERTG